MATFLILPNVKIVSQPKLSSLSIPILPQGIGMLKSSSKSRKSHNSALIPFPPRTMSKETRKKHSSKLHSKKKKDKTEKKKSHTSSSEGNESKQSSTKAVKKQLKDVKAEDKPEVIDSSGASPPKVKKPLNAFMLYMRDMRAKVTAEGTCKDSTVINQTIGKKWHSLSVDEQNKYYALANQMRQQHKEMYPSWTARDNYAQHSKKKLKHKTITAKRRPAVSVKKCRARYGLEQQDMWCGPCRRKKRCIRYVEEVSDQERGNEESEEDSTTAVTIEDGPNATDSEGEDNAVIAIEEGSTDSEGDDNTAITIEEVGIVSDNEDDNMAVTMEEVGIVTDNEDDDSAVSVIVEEIPTA